MKKIILFIAFMLILSIGKTQVIVKDTISKKIIFGLHNSAFGINFKDTIVGKKHFYRSVYVEPYVGYFFNRSIGVGIIGGYETVRTNMTNFKNENRYEIGAFTRYYYPFRFNSKKITELNTMLFLTEISYKFTSYQKVSTEKIEGSNKLNNALFTIIPFGFQFNLWKGLYFEFSSEYWVFSNNYQELRYRIGMEYHINKNNKKIKY